MLTTAFVLTDRMLAASATLPMEMWRAADATARGRGGRGSRVNVITTAATDGDVVTLSGFRLRRSHSLDESGPCDVVYLPALWRNPRTVLRDSAALYPWLRQRFEQGAMLLAVGTGCCFLAEAGLLDGKAATTHWHYFDQFARDYRHVDLKRQYFITQAGSLFCAASVNALADVTVHVIERFYGRDVATHVERNFSHEIRRPYEKYRYLEGDDLQHADELVTDIQFWMQTHIAERIPVRDLARRFGLSPRTLDRRFKDATGRSPLEYLQRQRIKTAKELLESTNLTIGEIAFRVGYQDQGHFTRLFVRHLSVRPGEYRKTVRAKLFSLGA
jgi:transcriptional regulator GlxA family with amidase domain